MSAAAARKAWIVAASIGAVEALKDQGVCRWNYTIRSLHQHAKSTLIGSYRNSTDGDRRRLSESSDDLMARDHHHPQVKRTEESMKKVLELSCWGPNTVRF